MSSIWGKNIKISLYGESHGSGVGAVIDGFPHGICIDEDYIKNEMSRRAPGHKETLLTTPRKEDDEYEIISGVHDGYTTGAPINVFIKNTNTRSQDYSYLKNTPRPSHSDYTGSVRYEGFNDIRGGGHFSARLTAGLVFAGAICKQILRNRGIYIGAHIKSIYDIDDTYFSDNEAEYLNRDFFCKLNGMRIPVIDESKRELMENAILEARKEEDSVGGVVECAIIGLEAGLGNPIFDSVESRLSHIMFSVPGVKGIEFGRGFEISRMKGSQANDPFVIEEATGKIITKTNNNGGINGGITNGMPVIFKAAFKPTPSISREQDTVDLSLMKDSKLNVKGRHDPCIAVRAVPVTEAAAAICISDMILNRGGYEGFKRTEK